MTFFPSTKVFLEIGPLNIYWYAIFSMLGALSVFYLSIKSLKKRGYTTEFITDLGVGSFISAYLGARIWYCLFSDISYYLSNPIKILAINDGGLAIHGGICFGVLYGFYFAKIHKLNFMVWLDAILPTLLVGQAIGRIGNFVNQEAYGTIVEASFFEHFPTFITEMMFIDGAYRMPTFLIEGSLNILGYFLIIFVYKNINKLKKGDLAYAYLMWAGIVRYIIEIYRTDNLMIGGLKMAQVTGIAFIVVGLLGTLSVFRKIFKTKKPVILWDLDGTIIDSEPAIIETYYQVLKNHDKLEFFTAEFKEEVIGPSLKATFEKYLPEIESEVLISEYRTINKELHKTHVTLMENAKETISHLHNEGYKMAIVSTKFHSAILLGLDMFDMSKYFDVIVGLDDVTKGKPDKEPLVKACELMNEGIGNVFFVGDTKLDILAAKQIGAYSIGYKHKKDKIASLKEYKPNSLITDLNEVISIVKEKIDDETI